jgi:hypothetical protein
MKLILPKNIFASIFLKSVEDKLDSEIIFLESSLISKELQTNTSAVALIPTLELINNRNLFVSSKVCISFDGTLSNSYFYFNKDGKNFQKIFLKGDVSINEVLLAKIIFSEMYSTEIEIVLDTHKVIEKDKDYLLAGDDNFTSFDCTTAMSMAEEISEFIELPYVNYVFVSMDKESLEAFNKIEDQIDPKVEDSIEDILSALNLKDEMKSFIKENLNSLYYSMTENEIDAIGELIKLIYYRGFIDDMFDVKFV